MMRKSLYLPGAILLCLMIPFQAGIVFAAEEKKEPPKDCCYEHPNYQGVCAVTPAEGETCQSILDYLNTQGTSNKTYCGSTPIRGGWTQTDCPKKEEETASKHKS